MSVTHCDGSGWHNVRSSEHYRRGRVPCSVCNPYLHEVWITPGKWERWLNGAPLPALVTIGPPMPEPCRPLPLQPITAEQGMRALHEAYTAELARIARRTNP